MKMYSVYDQKAECYGQPVFFKAHGEALRQLEVEARNKETLIGAHPEDFILFYVGCFDIASGVLIAEDPPLVLSRVSDLLPPSESSSA